MADGGAGLSFDPKRSRFLLIGVGTYTKGLENVPNAHNNLDKLKALLLDPTVVGVPESSIRLLRDPKNPSELTEVFIEEADAAEDLLFLYYVGRGLLGRQTHKLFPATANSTEKSCDFDGFDFEQVRLRLAAPRPLKRILILDCCFAGLAVDGSLGGVESLVSGNIGIATIEPRSSYSIAACKPNRMADAGAGSHYTGFTGELIDLLETGTQAEQPVLSMRTLFDELDRRIQAKPQLPRPIKQDRYDGETIAFVRNRRLTRHPTISFVRLVESRTGYRKWRIGSNFGLSQLEIDVGKGRDSRLGSHKPCSPNPLSHRPIRKAFYIRAS